MAANVAMVSIKAQLVGLKARLSFLLVLLVVTTLAPAHSSATIVRAGGPVVNKDGQAFCTFNFIFRSGSTYFVGTAAHCSENSSALSPGDRVRSGDPAAFLATRTNIPTQPP
ncbi:MAG: hypothetical protein ABR507_01210, partial [Actinomycetota bacterium]